MEKLLDDSLVALLKGYILQRVPQQEAEDILQSALLKAVEKLDSLRDEQRLGPWLMSIVRNEVTDFYRTRSKSTHAPSIPLDASGADFKAGFAEWIYSKIADLPDQDQEILRRVECNGEKLKDVAAKSGLNLSTAKSRIARARKRLKRMITDCCEVALDKAGRIQRIKPKSGCC